MTAAKLGLGCAKAHRLNERSVWLRLPNTKARVMRQRDSTQYKTVWHQVWKFVTPHACRLTLPTVPARCPTPLDANWSRALNTVELSSEGGKPPRPKSFYSSLPFVGAGDACLMQFAAADEQQLQWKAARAEFDVAAHALNDRLYPKEGHAAAAPRHPGSPLPPSWQDGDYLVARYGDLHGWQGHDYGVSGTQTATVDMLTMATEWDIIVAKDIGTQPVIEVTRFQTYDPFVGVILAEQVRWQGSCW